jgi:hypothetical protein
MRNPFTPSFGAPPPLLVGRDGLLDLFEEALAEGPGSPGYATVYTGSRGIGKTVTLNAAEDIARASGFSVISDTASAGFLERLIHSHLPALLPKKRRKVASFDIHSIGGVTLEPWSQPAQTLRSMVEQVSLTKSVLITLDELQDGVLTELRDLAVVLQHAIREGRRLAFCGAGLSTSLNALLKDKGTTFFRRADRHVLAAVNRASVATAFEQVVHQHGRTIEGRVARAAGDATRGFPFMIQLVGYHSWRQNPGRKAITVDDVIAGADAARRRVGRLVIEPALNDLSAVDRTFLLRMAVDDGPSRMGDIAQRMGTDANYASQYRLRLLGAGLIESAGHGLIDFALPGQREWLREHAAFDV